MSKLAPDGTMNNVEELLARDLSPQEESPVTDTHRKRSKSKRGKGSKGGVGGVGGVRTTKVNFVPKSKEERKQALDEREAAAIAKARSELGAMKATRRSEKSKAKEKERERLQLKMQKLEQKLERKIEKHAANHEETKDEYRARSGLPAADNKRVLVSDWLPEDSENSATHKRTLVSDWPPEMDNIENGTDRALIYE